MPDPENLAENLTLEQLEVNLFRGFNWDVGWKRIFGGQVIAQALLAAYATVEDRVCHSLHAYFIRPGDPSIPILYEVDRARDGGSFMTRRVVAIQHGQQILNLAASFQTPEEGFEHQAKMPHAPDPEDVPDEAARFAQMKDDLPPEMVADFTRPRPIDTRWIDPQSLVKPVKKSPDKSIWLRAKKPIGGDIALQQAVMAYASDMAFLETALRPHGVIWSTPGLQTASLDHAMWFHHPFDFHDWHLYHSDSPSASGGRGFVRGEMFSRDGKLVASMTQECLMRMRKPRG